MSNANDETLLEDEDGEDEYDLGNEEEEALLADDCDTEQDVHHGNIGYLKKTGGRKNIIYSDNKMYRESEEPLEDDVLDLDDFESDILENTEYADEADYSEAQDDIDPEDHHGDELQYHEEDLEKSISMTSEVDNANNNAIPDQDIINQEGASGVETEEHMKGHSLEDDLKGSRQKESEDEEEEDDKQDGEGRGRFKSERTTMISLKGNKAFGNIPDTLDGLITSEDKQEGSGRWKRSSRGGFSRGGFRGNQRGYGSNFSPRRKQQQQQGQNRPSNQNTVFPHQRIEGSADSMNNLLPPPFLPSSHKIHINPHFRRNVQPQPEAPMWNESAIGNIPSSNSGVQPPQFHDPPRFPPPSIGFGTVDPRDMQSNVIDHPRQQRQRTPPPQNPFHSGSGDRGGGYEGSSGHHDYNREPFKQRQGTPPQNPFHSGSGDRGGGYEGSSRHHDYNREPFEQSHGGLMPEAWVNPSQRLQESSVGPPVGHHHQYGGGHQHFPGNVHNERGGGEVLQHFRPTMQPGPLFSHVTSVAPPIIPQQNLLIQQQQQQHLQNLLRPAPPLHNAGIGQMMQLPPQEPHNRIPPPGFSPNDGRPVPSLHHGPPSPWQEPPVNRSPMPGQHMSLLQQQQQQHLSFHQGGPRSFPVERSGNLQGVPLHHIPHSAATMSAPPPPFHAGNMPQGPPPHPLHQQHPHQGQLRQNFNPPSMGSNVNSGPSGNHNNGRFPRQGSGNFQSSGFNRNPPPQQGPRPNRGGGHMAPSRGGLGQRRGMVPSIRPLQSQKQSIDEGFPPKRPSLDVPNLTLKPSPPKKRKMRKIMKSNLHEVETVDTLPDTTTLNEKETQGENETGPSSGDAPNNQPEDAAVLEYQKKIEQQKRLREKVLQQKEQRRKLMALKKQKELQEKAAGESSNDVPKGNAIATIVNRNPVEPSPSTPIKKEPVPIPPFVQPTVQSSEIQLTQQQLIARKKALLALKNTRGQNTIPRQQINRGMAMRGMGPRGMVGQPIRPPNPVGTGNPPGVCVGGIIQQGGQRYKIVQMKNEQGQLIRKKIPVRQGMAGRGNLGGRGQILEVNPQQIRPIGQGRGNIAGNKGQQVQMAGGSHRLVQVLPVQQQGHPQNQEPKVIQPNMILQRVVKQTVPSASQQPQQGRKVVVQNLGGGGDCASVESSGCTVVVENLAASTSEADLRTMCQNVGRVLNVQMVPNLRRALVEFAHPASAVTFFQRYQRKIVDLSMITVRLANS